MRQWRRWNMKCSPFIHDNFLLTSSHAKELYHHYVKELPIIDFHCHLPVNKIADNQLFENLYDIWLSGDHYKWRAMRTLGVDEFYCTGHATDKEKFLRWSETIPYLVRNPLFHWSYLELERFFGIAKGLSSETGLDIWEACNQQLATKAFSPRELIRRSKVEVLCTTDDPIDSLSSHDDLMADTLAFDVYPTFRPDRGFLLLGRDDFLIWEQSLQAIADIEISDVQSFLDALKARHDAFEKRGCRLSDHGLPKCPYVDHVTEALVEGIYKKIHQDDAVLTPEEIEVWQYFLLLKIGAWNAEKDWCMQLHLGAMRNNNTRHYTSLGPDVGFDSIGDFSQAKKLSAFLNTLQQANELPKVILYNLNPADNHVFATMLGNFQDGVVAGKLQLGSAWWFLDQSEGIREQLNVVSNMSLISKFVGMVTDSRSFLSFTRHEYFRRVLCQLFAEDIEAGKLPLDLDWIGKILQDICYFNAKSYFKFNRYSAHSLSTEECCEKEIFT